MKYIIGDIHGCYEEYQELLDKIGFSEKDELYILGDAMDRGPEPIQVIQDIMKHQNMYYIIGNHDLMMLQSMKKLLVEITKDNYDTHLSVEDIMDYEIWMQTGGFVTAQQFSSLPKSEQRDILGYIENSLVYEELEYQGKKFILVHAGIRDFSEDKELDEYDYLDLIYERPDYDERYYKDESIFVVTGHTPTRVIWQKDEVYEKNGHIAIDCGCVFGGQLAAYCVETGEITYVKSKKRYS